MRLISLFAASVSITSAARISASGRDAYCHCIATASSLYFAGCSRKRNSRRRSGVGGNHQILRRDYRIERNGFTVHLATKRNPPSSIGPVVAAWTTSEQTRELLVDSHVTELLYVPWTEEDVESFLQIATDPVRY